MVVVIFNPYLWGRRVHNFPNLIVIEQLEFELDYSNIALKLISHYAKELFLLQLSFDGEINQK